MKKSICLDIGGTNLRCALINENYEIEKVIIKSTSNSTVRPVNNVASSPERSVELLPVTKMDVFKVARKEAKAFSKISDSEINTIKEIEGESILSKLKGFVIALCIDGRQYSSEDFSQVIQDLINEGKGEITFVIGGSYGLSDKVISKSNLKLSFSKFTFPHQLMRLIFVEQIYRAFNIASHSAYHK